MLAVQARALGARSASAGSVCSQCKRWLWSWDLMALNCPASDVRTCDTVGCSGHCCMRHSRVTLGLLPASSRHASYRATSAPSHATALALRTPCHLPFSAITSLDPPALSLAFGRAPPMHGTSQCQHPHTPTLTCAGSSILALGTQTTPMFACDPSCFMCVCVCVLARSWKQSL